MNKEIIIKPMDIPPNLHDVECCASCKYYFRAVRLCDKYNGSVEAWTKCDDWRSERQ